MKKFTVGEFALVEYELENMKGLTKRDKMHTLCGYISGIVDAGLMSEQTALIHMEAAEHIFS